MCCHETVNSKLVITRERHSIAPEQNQKKARMDLALINWDG
ncbi:hypothetical protein [Vibrio vulnificus YJ016]|uniref:Uncharacterized protein n=1 Tax=Vibrio vulnificus (strain YJ016) TaxID=196600 RepID=Q7MEW3_VIBVY|nr:hypothetical protein [Vibrio vulnificus YJ016]